MSDLCAPCDDSGVRKIVAGCDTSNVTSAVIGRKTHREPDMRQRALRRFQTRLILLILIALAGIILSGCEDPEYDLSTPDKSVDAMKQMIEDGRADLLIQTLHLEPRDIEFADGVTEASAIEDVRGKVSDLLGQLYRVSQELRERYANEVGEEIDVARGPLGMIYGGFLEEPMADFLTDPFAFLRDQRERISTIDLGDGTAAVLWDDEPAFGGIGLQMREVDGEWQIDIPIGTPPISEFRPNTREEWAVIASMMLSFENALIDFEDRLNDGKFGSLADAAGEAGRMLGASAIVQGAIYAFMKQSKKQDDNASNAG